MIRTKEPRRISEGILGKILAGIAEIHGLFPAEKPERNPSEIPRGIQTENPQYLEEFSEECLEEISEAFL